MAKSKLVEKIVTEHKVSVEGILNLDNLKEDEFILELEEEGEVDFKKYLDKFNGKYIKLSISEKEETQPEE